MVTDKVPDSQSVSDKVIFCEIKLTSHLVATLDATLEGVQGS